MKTEIIKPIEQSRRGCLVIREDVNEDEHNKPKMQVDAWIAELFGESDEDFDRWLVMSPEGRILERCRTRRAAEQTAGFYGFMFGI